MTIPSLPKEFKWQDVDFSDPELLRIRLDLHTDAVKLPLEWQKLGLQQTRSGYGSKLTTEYMIHFCGRMRRVYATCFSNVASHWFELRANGKIHRIYVS
jgi:hypothetical protein